MKNRQQIAKFFSYAEFKEHDFLLDLLAENKVKIFIQNRLYTGYIFGLSVGSITIFVQREEYKTALDILDKHGYLQERYLRKNSDSFLYGKIARVLQKIPIVKRLNPRSQMISLTLTVILAISLGLVVVFPKTRDLEMFNRLTSTNWSIIEIALDGKPIVVDENSKKMDLVINGYDFSKDHLFVREDHTFTISLFQGQLIEGTASIRDEVLILDSLNFFPEILSGVYIVDFKGDSLFLHSNKVVISCVH